MAVEFGESPVKNSLFNLKFDGDNIDSLVAVYDLHINETELIDALKDIKDQAKKNYNNPLIPNSTVITGYDAKDSCKVAAKIYDPIDVNMEGYEYGLLLATREYWILSQLNNPHIMRPLGFYLMKTGNQGILPIMTMPLRDRVNIFRLSATHKKTVMIQIASALDYMHSNGVVHKDIKPDNILFQNGNATIIDFGIAQVEGMQDAPWAWHIQRRGTPNYVSPEAYRGEHTPKSDQYSFGVLAYLLAGGKPTVIMGEEEILVTKVETMSDKVWEAIHKATNPLPEKRYDSCTKFAYDFVEGL